MLKKPYVDVCEVFDKFPLLYGNQIDGQKERYVVAFDEFKRLFGKNEAFIASSSGRVEIIGNHTDHNGGKVVCCAISLDTLGFFLPTDDNIINIKSEGYPDVFVNLKDGKTGEKETSESLVRGVAKGLIDRGYKVGGFNAYFTSNVLGGAGISSSASYEVLVAEIFNFLYNDGKIDQKTKAIVSQFAENVFFGKPCGLLDQSAISYGGLKKLDFSTRGEIFVEDIKCDLTNYSLILVNTGGSHADLTDEYASIPREMYSVAACFGKERLVEVDEKEFYGNVKNISGKVTDRAILRAVHFYEENNRVDALGDALKNSDYQAFINAINKSGESSLCFLQNCYVFGGDQVIPKAIAVGKKFNPNGGCRVHGGGFAGCTLNVVKNSEKDKFVENLKKIYDEKSIIVLSIRSVGTIVL